MRNIISTKTITDEGIIAIKNGIKSNKNNLVSAERKPPWLRVNPKTSLKYRKLKKIVQQRKLHTVCEEAMCPNIYECWNHGTATFMLLGSVCTRACKFCAVDTGNPKGKLDKREPNKVATSIRLMGIKYAVITSVNRDDLSDGGAGHYAQTIRAIKKKTPKVTLETLVPDFLGQKDSIKTLLDSGPEVFAQNLETVERLTKKVRDPRAGYEQTLRVLNYSKKYKPSVLTKTSLILGLGESYDEIYETMKDIRAHGVDILTIGQYLRPTINHLPIEKWYSPEEFILLKEKAMSLGFLQVASGPMVRSSYRADKVADLMK